MKEFAVVNGAGFTSSSKNNSIIITLNVFIRKAAKDVSDFFPEMTHYYAS